MSIKKKRAYLDIIAKEKQVYLNSTVKKKKYTKILQRE